MSDNDDILVTEDRNDRTDAELDDSSPYDGSAPTDADPGIVEESSPDDQESVVSDAGLRETLAEQESLPDIAWASYGEPTEAIIGGDDRVQVGATASYPWRANCHLLMTAADGSRWQGTGWFIGPRTVMTAGHCVFIHAPGTPRHGWVRSVEVIPGRNGAARPYGSVVSSVLRSQTGWTQQNRSTHDYGAILLPTALGSTTGWYGFGVYNDATLRGTTANIAGYPGDKPAGTQWYHSGPVTSVNDREVFYTTDTMGGQSGSAVYRLVNGSRYAFAVHAYGGATSNHGARITAEVNGFMQNWKNS